MKEKILTGCKKMDHRYPVSDVRDTQAGAMNSMLIRNFSITGIKMFKYHPTK